MTKDRFVKNITIILILLGTLLSSACNLSWFEDLDEEVKSPILTVMTFYTCTDPTDETCSYKKVQKPYLIGTVISHLDFPYLDLNDAKPGYRIVGWKYYKNSFESAPTSAPPYVSFDGEGMVSGVYVNYQLDDFVAVWRLIEDVKYTVKHYFPKTDGSGGYIDDSYDEENPTAITYGQGQVDSYTNAGSLAEEDFPDGYDFDRFTIKKVDQQIIKEDGSTEVNVYYVYQDAKYTVRHVCEDERFPEQQFSLDEMKYGRKNELSSATALSEESFNELLASAYPGKDLTGYEYEYYEADEISQSAVATDGSTVVTVNYHWVKRSYKVEYYLQYTDSGSVSAESITEKEDFKYVLYNTQVCSGKKGDTTEAEAITDTIDPHYKLQPYEQETISDDNSTVVKIYYKWLCKYTVRYLLESETEDDYSISTGSIEKTSWYGVKTQAEGLDKTEWKNQSEDNIYVGTLEGYEIQDIVQVYPLADDTTTVDVKYKRKLMTVCFYDGKNSEPFATVEGRYLTSKIINISAPSWGEGYEDYEFDHWIAEDLFGHKNVNGFENPMTYISFYGAISYTAHWINRSQYKSFDITLEHSYEQYDGSSLWLTETLTEEIWPNELNFSSIQTYKKDKPGYEYYSWAGPMINENDGSDVYSYRVILYYRPVTYSVSFMDDDSTVMYTGTMKYTQPFSTIESDSFKLSPEREGYSFKGWAVNGDEANLVTLAGEDEFSEINDVTYKAVWEGIEIEENPIVNILSPSTPFEEKDLNLSKTVASSIDTSSSPSIMLTAPAGYALYVWIVGDDVIANQASNTYEWDYKVGGTKLSAGYYSLILVVKDDDDNWYTEGMEIQIK